MLARWLTRASRRRLFPADSEVISAQTAPAAPASVAAEAARRRGLACRDRHARMCRPPRPPPPPPGGSSTPQAQAIRKRCFRTPTPPLRKKVLYRTISYRTKLGEGENPLPSALRIKRPRSWTGTMGDTRGQATCEKDGFAQGLPVGAHASK